MRQATLRVEALQINTVTMNGAICTMRFAASAFGNAPNNKSQVKQQCIAKFLQNNYGDFLANKVVPDFSLVSIATNFSGYVKSSLLTLGVKGTLVAAPKVLGKIATATSNNLTSYPGMVGASADAAEAGLFWGTTATTAEWIVVPAATAATVFSTTADLNARWACRNVL